MLNFVQVIPKERLGFVKEHGIGLSPACLAALSSVSNAPAEDSGLTYTGMIRIIPDLSTRCRIPWYYLKPFYKYLILMYVVGCLYSFP